MSRREFHFEDGSSRKFWAVEVQGDSMTVQFGKIGTAGQTQVKKLAGASEAQKAADKLIAEKTAKGYVEVPAAGGAAASKPAAPAALPLEQRIRLDPEDWHRARWRRPEQPSARPEPRPFNFRSLEAVAQAHASGLLEAAWQAAGATEVASPQEARFWATLLGLWPWAPAPRGKMYALRAQQFEEPIPVADLVAAFCANPYRECNRPILHQQSSWLAPADWLNVACQLPIIRAWPEAALGTARWYADHAWPWLDEAQKEAGRAALRDWMRRPDPGEAATALVLAAGLGMDADVLQATKKMSGGALRCGQSAVRTALLALGDPAAVEAEFRRLGLRLEEPAEARTWLAHTEDSALDVLRDSILNRRGADSQVQLLDVLLLVSTPRAARALLEVKLKVKASKAVPKITRWFEKNPQPAAEGLPPLAADKNALGQAAAAWLNDHARRNAPAAGAAPRKPAAAAPAAPTLTPAGVPTPPRNLRLEPADLRHARGPGRLAPPPPLPDARPFDLDALKRLAAAEDLDAPPCDPELPVTPEEARFWLAYFSHKYDDRNINLTLRRLTAARVAQRPTLDEIKAACEGMYYWPCNLTSARLQRWWLPADDFVELCACHPVVRLEASAAQETACWLEAEFYPRLDDADRDAARGRLRKLLQGPVETALTAAILARHLDMAADLTAFAAGLKPGGISANLISSGFAAALFGMADAARLAAEFRRLRLRLVNPQDAKTWLALTEHSALDVLRDSILGQRKEAALLALLDVLLRAESPEAAVALLEVKLKANKVEAATRINTWFRKHPGHTLAGLAPLAGETTALGEAARVILAESAASAPAASSAPPESNLTPDWLQRALDAVQPAKKFPFYADPAVMPPLMGLEVGDVARVLTALAASTLAGPAPLVAQLRRHGNRAELAALAWKLFEGWLEAGASSKEKWGFLSLGHFGDDAAVMRLAPLIRAWPGESQHQRAVTGLEVLRTIGTDVALTQLHGMALKLKFKGLQERARAMMDAIATDRGLGRDELEDRIVPTLGLDADGTRLFDFGPRRFRFCMADDLSAAASDESGKVMKDLPKPGAKDDPALAAAAVAEWKLLKKQLRETLKVQVFRLEEAMITGRSWSSADFDALLARHPLMSHLVGRLVCAGLDASGGVVCHFLVNDQRQAVGHEGKPASLDGVQRVRVAHRLHMTDGQVGSWRSALDRWHVHPPFAQLDRPVHAVAPDEAGQTSFQRPRGDILAARMRGILEERGWRRVMHDQGGITGFNKPFTSGGVTGFVEIQPWILIGMTDNQDQRVERAYFLAGTNHPYGPCSDREGHIPGMLPLGQVDPVAYSEMMLDLLSLLPPGK